MKRSQILLSALGAVMLIALFYVLLFQPARDEVATIEAAIVTEQDVQADLTVEINRLRDVRERAPEVEAQLAVGEAVVPREAALPSALRQLQVAADESGVVLQSVATSRPAFLEGDAVAGLSSLDVNVQLGGGYFQVVDFLRRVEDPAISPRGVAWNNATIGRGEEYPELQVTLTGRLFALLSVPPSPETEEPVVEGEEGQEPEDADATEGAELEADVETESEDIS